MSDRFRKYAVTLTFRSAEQKDYFLGQLSDGLGESHFDLQWPDGLDLSDAEFVRVTPCGEYWEHHKRVRKYLRGVSAR